MQWLNPAGVWAFLALIPVLALYLLRKKAKRVPVPSLLLWRRTTDQSEVNRPFQKLRNQLLLWLQLLLTALVALALMRPASMGGTQGETALIIDLSASMQTQAQGQTRLELAKREAIEVISGMRDEDAVTLISAGATLKQLVSRSIDHAAAVHMVESLTAENGNGDLDSAVGLALAMRRDLPSLGIIVLSDSYQPNGADVRVTAVGESVPNRVIRSLRLSEQPDGLIAFAQLENIGPSLEAEMECYADGALCDVRTVTLAQDDTCSVRFSIPENSSRVMARFTIPDALPADDARYAVRHEVTQRRILLVGEGNVFLEKALALDDSLTVVKASLADAENADGFDLYIYDCCLPETLPAHGAIMAIAPGRELFAIVPGEKRDVFVTLRSGANDAAEELTNHLLLGDIALSEYTPLIGGLPVLTSGGDALLSLAETNDRRAAVIGFDLHNSNLPLKADFPLLIQNLISYLLPDAVSAVQGANCGETVRLSLDERTLKAQVLKPDGTLAELRQGALTDTDEIGLYTLNEELENGDIRETIFALHVPASESDTQAVTSSAGSEGGGRVIGTGREWTSLILLLALAVLLLEWEASRRGA